MAQSAETTSKAEALFVFHAWEKNKYGLSAAHRILIKDFCQRKRDVMKVYSTTLDLKLTEEQENDADDIGVNLIVAERKKWADEKHDPAVLRWLLDHEVHYPGLKDLKNIEYVIGYTPETHCAAADIQERLFPSAKLVLINYATASKDEEDEKFDEQMLEAASAAEVLFSLGPLTHKHFENEYQTEHNKKKLYDIPHLEIAPIPCKICVRENIPTENITEPVLFTYGKIDDEEALKRCGTIAAAIGNFSNTWKLRGTRHTVKWKIQGVSERKEMKHKSREFLVQRLKSDNTKLHLYSSSSIRKLATHLFQSHLCVPLPSSIESCFDGVEAMSSKVPVVSLENTHLAEFISEYFQEHMDSCIVGHTEEQLTERLQKVFYNIPLAFENAKRLKQDYINSERVLDTYDKFAALLTPSENRGRSKDNTDMSKLQVTFRFPEEEYNQYRQSSGDDEERLRRQDAAWFAYRSSFEDEIDALLPDEGRRQQVRQVIEDKCGCVDVLSMEKGSLAVTLHVPRLINLYRLERTTKSGSLAEAMEPVLITDEAKAMAERAGIPGNQMKLQVNYDQGTFQAIQQFFIKRDGGTVGQTFPSEDEIDELREDEEEYAQYEAEVEEEDGTAKGGTEIGSKRECEDCRNLKEMYQRECKRHDEREQNLIKKLTSQYSRIRKLDKTISELTPVQIIADHGRKSEAETIRLEWKVKTFGDAEDPVLLDYPCGVTFRDKNRLAVCDRDNYRVDVIDMVTKRASFLKFDGKFERPFRPQDVAISADNLLFITDRGNQQIVVSDEDSKEVRTFGHEQVKFEPFGIALMGSHAIVSDTAEHRILKYTTDGEYVDEIGGYGKEDGQFNEPYSVAVNSLNQVLASDFHNHRVQVFNSDFKFLRSVGTSGSSPGQLQNPYGINVDSDDNMYVCDFDNHRVAKFTKEGKFECNLFESDVNYPMYVAVSKGKADQFRIAVSQWQEDKITVFSQFTDK